VWSFLYPLVSIVDYSSHDGTFEILFGRYRIIFLFATKLWVTICNFELLHVIQYISLVRKVSSLCLKHFASHQVFNFILSY